MKLGYKALEGRWDESSAKWTLQLQEIVTGEIFEDRADALITAIGALNEWSWPQIPGLHDFNGKLLHSAAWDQGYDHKVRRFSATRRSVTYVLIGQESCCHWRRFEWNPNST